MQTEKTQNIKKMRSRPETSQLAHFNKHDNVLKVYGYRSKEYL